MVWSKKNLNKWFLRKIRAEIWTSWDFCNLGMNNLSFLCGWGLRCWIMFAAESLQSILSCVWNWSSRRAWNIVLLFLLFSVCFYHNSCFCILKFCYGVVMFSCICCWVGISSPLERFKYLNWFTLCYHDVFVQSSNQI